MLLNNELRGTGRYAVFHKREYEARGGDLDGIALWHFGTSSPDEGFERAKNIPDDVFIRMTSYSELESLESVSTRAWWRGGRFIVWKILGSTAAVEFEHQCEPGKDYYWFEAQQELEVTQTDRLGGRVPLSELYDVEQIVTPLPLEAPEWMKRRARKKRARQARPNSP